MLIDLGMIPRADGSDEPAIVLYISASIGACVRGPNKNFVAKLLELGYDVNAQLNYHGRLDALICAFDSFFPG